MKEIAEFRVDERFASMLFADGEGKRLGDLVRRVELETSDPRFSEVGRLQRELCAKHGRPFFYGWDVKREYGVQELRDAKLFSIRVSAVFEPSGEECGTEYDELSSCPRCDSGARQLGPLFLDARRIPKGKDFAKTIAGEFVISRRAAQVFEQEGVVGAAINSVRTKESSGASSSDWFQLCVQGHAADIVPPTKVGIDRFDDDRKGENRCPMGDLIGLNLLSEVCVDRSPLSDAGIVGSRQFIGARRGLLRPERVLLITQQLRSMIESEGLRGIRVEVAHIRQ
jgi:hypothetical protein